MRRCKLAGCITDWLEVAHINHTELNCSFPSCMHLHHSLSPYISLYISFSPCVFISFSSAASSTFGTIISVYIVAPLSAYNARRLGCRTAPAGAELCAAQQARPDLHRSRSDGCQFAAVIASRVSQPVLSLSLPLSCSFASLWQHLIRPYCVLFTVQRPGTAARTDAGEQQVAVLSPHRLRCG